MINEWQPKNFEGIESPLAYTIRRGKWTDRPTWKQYTTWWIGVSVAIGFDVRYPFLWYLLLWLPDPNNVSKKNVFVLSGSVDSMDLSFASSCDVVVDGGLSASVVPPTGYVSPSAVLSSSGQEGIIDYVSSVIGTFSRDIVSELSISGDQKAMLSIFCTSSGDMSISSRFVGVTFRYSSGYLVPIYGYFIGGHVGSSSIPGCVTISTEHAIFIPVNYTYLFCDSNQNTFAFSLNDVVCEAVVLDTSVSVSGVIDLTEIVTGRSLSFSSVATVDVDGFFANMVDLGYSTSLEVSLSGVYLYNFPEYSCLFCDSSGQNVFGLCSGNDLFTFLITHVICSSVGLLSLQTELANVDIRYSGEGDVAVSGDVIAPKQTFMLSDNSQNTYGFVYNDELYVLEEVTLC